MQLSQEGLEELFINEMVEQQEFVEDMLVTNTYTDLEDITPHPFSQSQETKLNDLFGGKVAEHTSITVEMVEIVLSDYAQGIGKRLKEVTDAS